MMSWLEMPSSCCPFSSALRNAINYRFKRDAARGVRLQIEENFGVHYVVLLATQQVSPSEVEKVLLVDQNVGALVVNIEERLQIRKLVGRTHFIRGRKGNRNLVTLGEVEHQFRLQRPFNVQVKFYFR